MNASLHSQSNIFPSSDFGIELKPCLHSWS
jgi:hypothetical protein